MERNVKLFPIYKLFSYDTLFFYAISILFYTTTKGFSLSQVALVTTVYSVSCIVAQIPCAIITDKIGLRNSMIIGNILCMIWGIFYILCSNFNVFVLGEVFSGFGFSLKGVAETPFLYSSLKKLNRVSDHSKIEGKGSSFYYLIEAIASIVAGYLFTINAYLPVIFALTCYLISTIIAFYMKPIKTSNHEKLTPREHLRETFDGFKYILKSKRLHGLFLFSMIFFGTLSLGHLYIKTYFNDINLPSEMFGYVFAAASVASAFGSAIQHKVEAHRKNKTLASLAISYIVSFVIIGICSLMIKDYTVLVVIGIGVFIHQSRLSGNYYIIMKTYISRYTTSAVRTKIMSVYNLVNNIGKTVILLIASYTIDLVPTGISYVVFGITLFIVFILILNYMSSRVGLDPSKYTKRDRFDLED